MNKAICPNDNDGNTIMKQLEHIKASAIMDDKYFCEDNYKWCLGAGVISNIDVAENIIHHSQNEKRTLFGIAIDIDYHNIFRMELWKNITNDII